jgi:hypothetical protein
MTEMERAMDRFRMLCAWVAVLGLGLAGCGDANVFEDLSSASGEQAQLERGVAALNEGDWDAAIATFEQMDLEDPEVRKYLASAYVGKSGFDTLELVDLIADAQDSEAGSSVLYDSVVQLLGDADGDGSVSSGELLAKEADVADALAVLAPGGDADDEETFQAGVYAALHAVILVADVLNLDDVSQDAVQGLTDEEIDAQVTEESFGDVEQGLETDLALILDAIGTVVDSDVSEDLDSFIEDIGFDDQDMTTEDLQLFLKDL